MVIEIICEYEFFLYFQYLNSMRSVSVQLLNHELRVRDLRPSNPGRRRKIFSLMRELSHLAAPLLNTSEPESTGANLT